MDRQSRILGLVALAVLILFLVWWKQAASKSVASSRMQQAISSAISEPAEFAKQHFTGGVGVALMSDPASGFVKVGTVLPGSPAQAAGLRAGDIITSVGNQTTAGQPLSNVVEAIRGFAGAKVTVTVKRPGSNSTTMENLTFVIHRSSWNALGITNSTPAAPGIPMTNTVPVLLPAPRTTN